MSLKMFGGILIAIALLGGAALSFSGQAIQRTRSPHGNLNIPCQNCHVAESWRPARREPAFDHTRQTMFPLLGRHQKVNCVGCHVSPVFSAAAPTCSSCHADIHRRQFGASCESCHTVEGWRIPINAVRQHANRFPLVGAHASTDCESCHRGAASATFVGLSTACISCHAADYAAAKTIDHKTAGFGANCETCPSMSRWRYSGPDGQFDHAARTGFPLMGAHSSASCTDCHMGGRFAGTPQDCYSCHSANFTSAINPNHVSSAFPTNCAICHGTTRWTPAAYDHSRTRFPLLGAHASATCVSCHASGPYTGTPTACAACHLAQFTATTSPNHVAANFPQDCQLCHSTTQWPGATFNHSGTRFPLTGAHTNVACVNCHVGGTYAGTPTDCYSCHATEFNTVTSPNHKAAGFPTTCASCHTTTTWSGATVTHKFPIYSGSHAGKWSTCNDCHTNSSNYAIFSCVNCHAHDKATMDSKHSGRTGYVWDSLSCYGCHPNGQH
ncbi:MAG TPA: hypothetical protein VFY29_05255 [Terriglobia bacterium]|nr:hypothetical protein [Terriglobia bacterium]